jgi:long-subunit acyl-CoA synthetase (AMP-forming)
MHFALLHIQGTTIALYDTLGQDAARYVCDQTELQTICCSSDLIPGLIKLKQIDLDGDEKKMEKVANVVSFDANVDKAVLTDAEKVGLKIVTLDEVIEQGKSKMDAFELKEP